MIWRANPRGTQKLRRKGGQAEQSDWWIRWACPHGHLHRALVGPKSLAAEEVQRKRLERSCPRRQPRPVNYLVADVIRDYLAAAEVSKRSYRNDERYGHPWTDRRGGRCLEEVTPADLEKIRAGRLAGRLRRQDDEDLKAGVLTIPRSKHGEARHVPLTSGVRAIISRRPRSLDASAL